MKSPKRSGGFSLVEVMIAAGVISIGLLGAMAAIAFGLRASDRGSRGTFALNVNRRIIEWCQNFTHGCNCINGSQVRNGSYPYGFVQLSTPPSPELAPLAAPWHRLVVSDGSWFAATDFVPAGTSSPDYAIFMQDALNYENCVSLANYSDVNTAAVGVAQRCMVIVTVQTRWHDKGGWRCVRTDACMLTSQS